MKNMWFSWLGFGQGRVHPDLQKRAAQTCKCRARPIALELALNKIRDKFINITAMRQ